MKKLKMNPRNNILNNIELTRKEMIDLGIRYGFTNPRTIKKSEKLDELLNLYGSYSKGHC